MVQHSPKNPRKREKSHHRHGLVCWVRMLQRLACQRPPMNELDKVMAVKVSLKVLLFVCTDDIYTYTEAVHFRSSVAAG